MCLFHVSCPEETLLDLLADTDLRSSGERVDLKLTMLPYAPPEAPSPPTPNEILPADPLLRLPVPLKTQSMSAPSALGVGAMGAPFLPARAVWAVLELII